ncbi:hypothetical protein THRCLA_05976 [Thraustotheca clavata]|uniref:Serine/threonine-protein phosphatase PGAM5, mitochondrial n=1 Tax=Thraustotheca clavata TaxID=74557 RepID=A0A1V9ZQU0_9STRA|nr:hypothetical protein THRCLA_05976 [Thraustotheca clavata]
MSKVRTKCMTVEKSPSTSAASSPLTSPNKHAAETTGYLLIKVDEKDWTKHYCTLVNATLSIYDNETSKTLERTIDMSYRTIESPKKPNKNFNFSLSQGTKDGDIIECRANNEKDMERWIDALSMFAQKLKQTKKQRFAQTSAEIVTLKVAPVPPKVLHLVLVRHGHYVNAHTKNAKDTDKVLSHIGIQQAELTGQHLQEISAIAPSRDDMIILHSDMHRAVETATIISEGFSGCALTCTAMLREGWPGTPMPGADSMLSEKEQILEDERLENAYRTIFSFNDDHLDEEFVHAKRTNDSCRVVVCHANLIRYFICKALGISPVSVWGLFEINHCSLTRIDIGSNGQCKVLSVNECGHLPSSLHTSSEDHL